MNTNNIYSETGELQYTPYVYQITIEKEGEFRLYIGSKTHKTRKRYLDGCWYLYANPQLFLDGLYNGQGKVNDYLNDGWVIKERKVIEIFSGDDNGQRACCQREGELLRAVNAGSNNLYLNEYASGAPFICVEMRKKMSAARKGKKLSAEHRRKLIVAANNRKKPFTLHAELPCGSKESYTFKKQPQAECIEFGIPTVYIAKMWKGYTHTIQMRTKQAKHPFPIGTKLTIELL